MADFLSVVAHLRQQRRQPIGGRRLRSPEDMLAYIDRVGFCLLFPHAPLDLPNIADIADGSFRRWKDKLVARKLIYYGRSFRRRSGFVSLELLPALYALTPTAEYHGDRFELYSKRFLSAEANRLAGIVHAKGPLPTRILLRESGLSSGQRYRFKRALIDAESRYLVARTGLLRSKTLSYSYLWDAFTRFLPDIALTGSKIQAETAATAVITRYLDNAIAATIPQIAGTFTLNEAFVTYIAHQAQAGNRLDIIEHNQQTYLTGIDLREHYPIR